MVFKEVHLPVLVKEVVSHLKPKREMVYCDGTVGAGGHAAAIVDAVEKEGSVAWVIGLDRDREMLSRAGQKLHDFHLRGHKIDLVHASYQDLPEVLPRFGLSLKDVDAVLLDLGVNSFHFDEPDRGFSFSKDGPLDMRLDQTEDATLSNLLEEISENDLANILREFGEEKFAGRIAKRIKGEIEKGGLDRTHQLADVIRSAIPAKFKDTKIDPATRSFQALRIALNQELHHLDSFLQKIPEQLAPGARIGVISFHSLEDRRVKQAFQKYVRPCECPPDLPICTCGKKPVLRLLHKKPIMATAEEIQQNPRSRSARLRVAERV